MLKICAFLVKILFWQMQNAVIVSKFVLINLSFKLYKFIIS